MIKKIKHHVAYSESSDVGLREKLIRNNTLNETIKVDAYIKHLQQVKENANEWLTKYRTQLANIS